MDNPEDNLFFHIKGAFAQYDRAKIRRNTSLGRKRKALTGQIVIPGGWTGHPGPYGYTYVRDHNGSRLEINEKEAEIVRYIYSLAYDEKYGIRRIVEHLNNEGIPSPKGSIWHSSTVGRTLKNELYTGVFYNLKFRSQMTDKRTAGGRRKVHKELRPLEERIPVPVPAIIDRHIWEAVQTQLKQNASRNQKIGSFFLLKGRVKCGLCGRSCAAETSGKVSPITKSRRTYYRCKGTKTGAYPKCNLPSVASITNSKNPGLDDLVWAEIVKVINNPEIIKGYLSTIKENTAIEELNKQMIRLENKLHDLEKQKEELLNLRMEGLLTAEELKKRLLKLKTKKTDAKIELNNTKKAIESTESVKIDPVKFCEYFQEKIKAPSNEAKAKIVNDLDIKVMVYSNKRFEVYWPFKMITGIKIEKEIIVGSAPVSMTPEMKKSFYNYCDQHSTTASAVIRQTIREAPLDSSYKRIPRGNRFRSTVELTQDDLRKVSMIQQKFNISASQAVEWALETFLKNNEIL